VLLVVVQGLRIIAAPRVVYYDYGWISFSQSSNVEFTVHTGNHTLKILYLSTHAQGF